MTNGELFIKENPTVETKINGSCVWIYFYDYNHYTMPVEWWDKEIDVLDKIRAEIQQVVEEEADDKSWSRGLHYALKIIDRHTGKEQSE